jgi:hypothetical protein
MTVSDLIAKLSSYPAGARVTLLDPDNGWLLPIAFKRSLADGSTREVDFVVITADSATDESEGMADSIDRRRRLTGHIPRSDASG